MTSVLAATLLHIAWLFTQGPFVANADQGINVHLNYFNK